MMAQVPCQAVVVMGEYGLSFFATNGARRDKTLLHCTHSGRFGPISDGHFGRYRNAHQAFMPSAGHLVPGPRPYKEAGRIDRPAPGTQPSKARVWLGPLHRLAHEQRPAILAAGAEIRSWARSHQVRLSMVRRSWLFLAMSCLPRRPTGSCLVRARW